MNSVRLLAFLVAAGSTLLFFQNCGKISADATDVSSKAAVHNEPTILASGGTLTNTDISFTIHNDDLVPNASIAWSHKVAGVMNACQVKTSSISRTYTINCGVAGELVVSAKVTDGNTPVAVDDYLMMLASPTPTPIPTLPPAGTPPPGGAAGTIAMVVNFNIAAGTGTKPWNVANQPVEVFIGQTLRLNNMDTVTHRLHTGGAPCPHGANFAPNASANCVITRAASATTVLYDHIAGTNARFYLIAYDGNALYAQNCAGCHGALAANTVPKKTVAEIQNAIANVPVMKAAPALQALTLRQLEAIAYALGAR